VVQVLRRSQVHRPCKEVLRPVRKSNTPDDRVDDRGNGRFGFKSVLPRKNRITALDQGGLQADGEVAPHSPQKRKASAEASNEVPEGKKLVELYGHWQTEAWDPGCVDAETGEVPTNAFGNIELWTAKHLPRGCVHVPYAGRLNVVPQVQAAC